MDRKEEYQDERWKARAKEIRELDGNQCKMCGATGVELHVHHLSYPPPPFHLWDAADNELVTLCKDCHLEVHKQHSVRPVLDDDRECFFPKHTEAHPCSDCYFFMQPYGFGTYEKEYHFCDGTHGFGGCNFEECIKCEECVYLHSSHRKECDGYLASEQIACEDYLHKECSHCVHFNYNSDSECYKCSCYDEDFYEKEGSPCCNLFEFKQKQFEKGYNEISFVRDTKRYNKMSETLIK